MFSFSPTHAARTDSSPPILNHPNQKIPTRRWDKGAPTNILLPPRKVDIKTATHPPWSSSCILHPPYSCVIHHCLLSPPPFFFFQREPCNRRKVRTTVPPVARTAHARRAKGTKHPFQYQAHCTSTSKKSSRTMLVAVKHHTRSSMP